MRGDNNWKRYTLINTDIDAMQIDFIDSNARHNLAMWLESKAYCRAWSGDNCRHLKSQGKNSYYFDLDSIDAVEKQKVLGIVINAELDQELYLCQGDYLCWDDGGYFFTHSAKEFERLYKRRMNPLVRPRDNHFNVYYSLS